MTLTKTIKRIIILDLLFLHVNHDARTMIIQYWYKVNVLQIENILFPGDFFSHLVMFLWLYLQQHVASAFFSSNKFWKKWADEPTTRVHSLIGIEFCPAVQDIPWSRNNHLVTNPFFVIILSFISKFSNFFAYFPMLKKIHPKKVFILSNCSLFSMISSSCLSSSGVRGFLIKFVNWIAFDFIASIICSLGSSHS